MTRERRGTRASRLVAFGSLHPRIPFLDLAYDGHRTAFECPCLPLLLRSSSLNIHISLLIGENHIMTYRVLSVEQELIYLRMCLQKSAS